MANSKVADLAGPGIGNYTQLEKVLPNDYRSALTRRETQKAIFTKRFIEVNLCKECECSASVPQEFLDLVEFLVRQIKILLRVGGVISLQGGIAFRQIQLHTLLC